MSVSLLSYKKMKLRLQSSAARESELAVQEVAAHYAAGGPARRACALGPSPPVQ